MSYRYTVKALLSPRGGGGLFNFRGPRGGLIGEDGLFKKSRSRIYLHGDQGRHEQLVGHLPVELSFLLCKFPDRQGCNLRCLKMHLLF